MIPIYQPNISGNEEKYVLDCLHTSWISSKGKYVKAFEEAFAEYLGVKHATSVSNGTVALHLAMVALGIGPGDEVIVPTFTYIASVNTIVHAGATPVFVDSDPETWQVDSNDILNKITPKTRAVMAVHLYGAACDMDKIVKVCQEKKLYLIEDCAEAIGTEFKGKKVGSFGDVATFSFFGNKTITTGEGGMVVTNNDSLLTRLNHFKGQGLAKYREYWHDVIGYNYRMTNICAAIGLAQLEKVEIFLQKKISIADSYRNLLKNLPLKFHDAPSEVKHSYWMCTILVDTEKTRDALRTYLKEREVETRPTFYPIHLMPMYSAKYEKFPVAEDIALRGINLPSFPDLKQSEIESICTHIKSFYESKN